jgi:hypothetical protein
MDKKPPIIQKTGSGASEKILPALCLADSESLFEKGFYGKMYRQKSRVSQFNNHYKMSGSLLMFVIENECFLLRLDVTSVTLQKRMIAGKRRNDQC